TAVPPADAAETIPQQLEGVTISEHLGAHVNLDLAFTDHAGARRPLRDFVPDDKPTLLTLNYYECPMLCTLQLNALVTGMKGMPLVPGRDFSLVTISINPEDTATLAREKRETYLGSLGKSGADWNFLIGETENIDQVANAVGFEYRKVEETGQYAHPAAIFFLDGQGQVTRYLYGLEYPGRDLKFALMETSDGHLGSPIEKLILSCFHYDATAGAYGPWALGIMRLSGGLTAVAVAVILTALWRRERHGRPVENLT
ncbi:SCO family protein, partial [bacterium]|nr:SCO family protein [bacterium]